MRATTSSVPATSELRLTSIVNTRGRGPKPVLGPPKPLPIDGSEFSLESGKLDRKVLRSKGKRNRWEPDRRNDAMDEAIASAEAAANAADASKAASACQEAEMRVGGRKEEIEKEPEKGSR